MTQIATVRLIGSALALVRPAWLSSSREGLAGDAVLIAITDRFGDDGLVYLEIVADRLATTADALLPDDEAGLALEQAVAILDGMRTSIGEAGASTPEPITKCAALLDHPDQTLPDDLIADAASGAAGWITGNARVVDQRLTNLLCAALATLLVSKAEQPAPRPADTESTIEPDGEPPEPAKPPRIETLVQQVRDHARLELQRRLTPELEDFGLFQHEATSWADAARDGDAGDLERAARRTEQRIVQAAIADIAHARRLSTLAATCRAIRAWGACCAGRFADASTHFKLAVRHLANEPYTTRASFLTASIDLSVLASFIDHPESALLSARERAADLGAMVKQAPIEARLQAALVIGNTELAVGRGFDQAGTCSEVISFADKVAAEARLSGLESIALSAATLKSRAQVALVLQFGHTSLLPSVETALAALLVECDELSASAPRTGLERLQALLIAAKAIDRADPGALALSQAELAQAELHEPRLIWASVRTAADVSDALDAAYQCQRAALALAALNPETAHDQTLAKRQAEMSANFGTWLSPCRAALLHWDVATAVRAHPGTTPDHKAEADQLGSEAAHTLALLNHPVGLATQHSQPDTTRQAR